ncbi:glycosyltransferase family 4 protein [uncultured Streptomyces sp.]|uniref:glycosyltransferase family 4 protein n=1 Tax=uncultured Streptomyces sp. TaxID=174707 RepID=UPI00261C03A7|nr:glycosyltransferase family 4 protein [uncultured Streptomyces sp.]
MSQLRTVQVLGGGGAGSGAHVASLAAGLVARGVHVTVCAPEALDRSHDFSAAGARFVPVPRRGDPVSVAALRAACTGANVVHAHGLHAGARAALALGGLRIPLVVTWHTRAQAEGARRRMRRLTERRVARSAAVVLGVSSDLVDVARRRGARDARLAPVALPERAAPDDKIHAELGVLGRPLLFAAASPGPHGGLDVLLDAARDWRGLDPVPLLIVVDRTRVPEAYRRRVTAERLPVRFADSPDGLPELLAVADLVVLAGHAGARSPLAREALRTGVPVVAMSPARELLGDAAVRVPPGGPEALARAVAELLGDPERRELLAAAGREQARGRPTEDDTVAHVLSVYDELAHPLIARGR